MSVATRDVASRMAEAASDWLAALTPELRARANPPFADPRREVWYYTPTDHEGIALAEQAVALAHLLVADADRFGHAVAVREAQRQQSAGGAGATRRQRRHGVAGGRRARGVRLRGHIEHGVLRCRVQERHIAHSSRRPVAPP